MDVDKTKKLIKRIGIVAIFFLLGGVLASAGLETLLYVYVTVVAVVMVLAILLQAGKGGGLASLGGLSGDTLLGTRSATPIAKATAVLAALFLFLCMVIRISEHVATSPLPVGGSGAADTSDTTGGGDAGD